MCKQQMMPVILLLLYKIHTKFDAISLHLKLSLHISFKKPLRTDKLVISHCVGDILHECEECQQRRQSQMRHFTGRETRSEIVHT